MKKAFSAKAIVIMLVIVVAAVLTIPLFITTDAPPRVKDTEFKKGSNISFTEVSRMQTENLHKLAKVWGFVKYRHPSVTAGELNWDAELFRVLPGVLDVSTAEEANKVIFDWLNRFPFEVPQLDAEMVQVVETLDKMKILESDSSWITEAGALGADVSAYLTRLSEVKIIDDKYAYATFSPDSGFVSMTGEDPYSDMKYDDTGMRLLGLFRYWNIIEYYYPYTDIMGEDWDKVLSEMIPKFIGGQDEQSYVLSVAELTTRIHDSHASVRDTNQLLIGYYGKKAPPVEFMYIDGDIVISDIEDNSENAATSLQPGDIVLSMDGISIADRIDNCRKYTSLSNDVRFARRFRYRLLTTDKDTAQIEVLRDNKPLSLTVACRENIPALSGQEPSGFLEKEQIGYINPSKLQKGEIDKLMEKFASTKGIIVDLRQYPSDFIVFTLAEHIIPDPVPFVKFGFGSSIVPGEFVLTSPLTSGKGNYGAASDKPLYPNKVVLLMDETSISQSEYTIMSLRNGPNAVVLGSPSIGADGDVVEFKLPGALSTSMTGISVFYPDGRQTQRVGLEPDIYYVPTVEDIKKGGDALVDKAVSVILNGEG